MSDVKALVLVPVLAATLVASAATATTGAGLYGTVSRGPITPVCVAEQPCSAPAPGAVVLFARGEREVARVKAGPAGRYRLALAPGRYTVRTPKRPIDPSAVVVRHGRMARVDFSIDTGIR
jgi:hypothetical protein